MTGKIEDTPGMINQDTGMINDSTGLIENNAGLITETNDIEHAASGRRKCSRERGKDSNVKNTINLRLVFFDCHDFGLDFLFDDVILNAV